VYARCRWLLGDGEEARDAMQEVFMRALQGMDGFRGAASPVTWMITIATRHCLNLLRGRRAGWRQAMEDGRAPAARPQELWSAERAERREWVRAVLARVDDETARAAVHYWVDEMTQDEIAEALGRSLPTVRKRLREFEEAAKAALEAA
jgi:RNA polymerase sigma-70 factor (ECF subfamily)